jgi:hypothetical protein
MRENRIIGLAGKARSGKDLLGNYLVRLGFNQMAFANNLKEACRSVFNLSYNDLHGDKKDSFDEFWRMTPREILQKVGTECFRKNFGEDVWIRSLRALMTDFPDDDIVITDVRFKNEAEAIKSWGGRVFKIIRPDAPEIATSNHSSEHDLDDWDGWDGIIMNDSTIEEFYKNAANILHLQV